MKRGTMDESSNVWGKIIERLRITNREISEGSDMAAETRGPRRSDFVCPLFPECALHYVSSETFGLCSSPCFLTVLSIMFLLVSVLLMSGCSPAEFE